MASLRPSDDLKNKTDSTPVLDRKKEIGAGDTTEISVILEDHADGIDVNTEAAATADAKAVVAQTSATQGINDAATADAKAVAAQTDATQGINDAATADAKAVAAQTDATQGINDAATTDAKAVAAQTDATQGINDAATADAKAVAAQADATQGINNAATADAKAVTAKKYSSSDMMYFGSGSIGQDTVVLEYDTSTAILKIPANLGMWLFTRDGNFPHQRVTNTIVDDYWEINYADKRILVWNSVTGLFRGEKTYEGNGAVTLIGDNDYLVCVLHGISGLMQCINAPAYKINGKTYYNHYNEASILATISSSETNANSYTDNAIELLKGTAPEAYNTLQEIALWISSEENEDDTVEAALLNSIGIIDSKVTTVDTKAIEAKKYSSSDMMYFGSGIIRQDTVVLEYDTSTSILKIPSNLGMWLFTRDGNFPYQRVTNTVVNNYWEINYADKRILVWNSVTGLFRGEKTYEGNGAVTLIGDNDYLVCVLHGVSGLMQCINAPAYKINGKTYYNSYKEPDATQLITGTGFNSLDYVKGQEAICEKYSVPVCDLYRKSGLNYQNKSQYISGDNLHYATAGYIAQSKITTEFIRQYGGFTDADLVGKSIGIFGGSFSVKPESQSCKDVWVSELGITYTDYGLGGYGFAKVGAYISNQIPAADIHDIYILWCSTNDVTGKTLIGDNTSTPGLTSQNAGIAKCIEDLIAKSPTSKILLFNTIKSYTAPYLYDPTVVRL